MNDNDDADVDWESYIGSELVIARPLRRNYIQTPPPFLYKLRSVKAFL